MRSLLDHNIRHQQNLAGRRLAMMVFDTNHWPTLRLHLPLIEAAFGAVAPGGYVRVAFPRLPLKRRVFNPGGGLP